MQSAPMMSGTHMAELMLLAFSGVPGNSVDWTMPLSSKGFFSLTT